MLIDKEAITAMQEVMDTTTGEPQQPNTAEEVNTNSAQQVAEPVLEAYASRKSSDTAEDVKDNADMQSEETPEDSYESGDKHRVPYKRFKSVLDARNKYRNDVSEYKSKMSLMEQQLEQLKSTPSPAVAATESNDDGWLNDLLSDDQPSESSENHKDNNYKSLEDRLYKFEVQQAQVELNKEITSATEQYPNVPRNFLLQAVVQNSDVNVMEVAEQYNTYVAGIEEQAIQRYVNDSKEKPGAAPRGRSAGSSVNTRNAAHDSAPTRTMKDAKSALMSFMKGNKQFNV